MSALDDELRQQLKRSVLTNHRDRIRQLETAYTNRFNRLQSIKADIALQLEQAFYADLERIDNAVVKNQSQSTTSTISSISPTGYTLNDLHSVAVDFPSLMTSSGSATLRQRHHSNTSNMSNTGTILSNLTNNPRGGYKQLEPCPDTVRSIFPSLFTPQMSSNDGIKPEPGTHPVKQSTNSLQNRRQQIREELRNIDASVMSRHRRIDSHFTNHHNHHNDSQSPLGTEDTNTHQVLGVMTSGNSTNSNSINSRNPSRSTLIASSRTLSNDNEEDEEEDEDDDIEEEVFRTKLEAISLI